MKTKYFSIILVLGLCYCQKELPHDVVRTPVDFYVAGGIVVGGYSK